ncbi:MAG: hypothetical protein ACRDPD_21155 [Streptosporangiaceae bacterium]
MTVPARDWLRLAGGAEEDQLPRLAGFRAGHPDVLVGDGGFGTWQALIPEPDGFPVKSTC